MKLGENATWKKHQNLPSNNNDAQSITKYRSLVRPNTMGTREGRGYVAILTYIPWVPAHQTRILKRT